MTKPPKRPRDVSQLDKMMVDIASGETETLPNIELTALVISRGTRNNFF